jgi:ribosomal protein S18 acetylase RimI-like enzyme
MDRRLELGVTVHIRPAAEGPRVPVDLEQHHQLSEAGLSKSQLAVEKRNLDAIRLYERLRYEVCGESVDTWPEPAADGRVLPVDHPSWVMRKTL